MMRAMTTPHEGELAQASLDGLYRWDAEQPGMSLTGTYRGRLLLTSRRLLFLSIGGSGLANDLAMTALFGPLGATLARTPTSDLDMSALEREGSEAFRLESIASLEKVRRWDFSSYLRLRTESGATSVFMTKLGWNPGQLVAFAEATSDALATFRSYRGR